MNFIDYVCDRLVCNDRVERHFAYLICLVCFNTLVYIAAKPFLGSLICDLWSGMLLVLIYTTYYSQNILMNKYRWFSELCKLCVFLLLMFVSLTFYQGMNYAQGAPVTWDSTLINADNYLLGRFFPKGQLSLYLDTEKNIGVQSEVGKVYAEIFQWIYVSYYFHGNLVAAYLLLNYGLSFKDRDKSKQRLNQRILLMFSTTWCSGFLINYLTNLIFPAVSPRIYLEYQNPIQGVWLTEWFRTNIAAAAANTYGAFPSAHCGVSFIVPVVSYRLGLTKTTVFTLLLAICISLSTLVLRYHYFVDFIAGIFVTVLSCYFGGFHSQDVYDKSVEKYMLDLNYKL